MNAPFDSIQTFERTARLARAREYPYDIPRHSYFYRDQGIAPFEAAMTMGRTPVLAIGSNQSPTRLAQKFGHDAGHEIPVQRAQLHDFDVVYSAHISTYGAVPAMVQRCEGVAVTLFVTWLDERQLEIMHATEISNENYCFAELSDIRLVFDDQGEARNAHAYVGRHGHLTHQGRAIPLAVIPCENRHLQAMTTDEVLGLVQKRIAPQSDPDVFVLRLIDDPDFRRSVTRALSGDSVAFDYSFRVVDTSGDERAEAK